MAFPRFLVLGMLIGRTHLESGHPFHMHLDNDLQYGFNIVCDCNRHYTQVSVQISMSRQHTYNKSKHPVRQSYQATRSDTTACINHHSSLVVVRTLPTNLSLLMCLISQPCVKPEEQVPGHSYQTSCLWLLYTKDIYSRQHSQKQFLLCQQRPTAGLELQDNERIMHRRRRG